MFFPKHKGHPFAVRLNSEEERVLDDLVKERCREIIQPLLELHQIALDAERHYASQLQMDLFYIALNRYADFGPKRIADLFQHLLDVTNEYCGKIEQSRAEENGAYDYAKGSIDRVLARILGPNFLPWEERYAEYYRKKKEWHDGYQAFRAGDTDA